MLSLPIIHLNNAVMTLRPTTKDLAKHLGMSRSTVDRVLNGRSGVKEKTVKAVEKAIEELGFQRNISAANLARNRVYKFEFILPDIPGEFQKEIENQIHILKQALNPDGIEIGISHFAGQDPHKIAAHLTQVDAKQFDGIAILAKESPEVRDAVRRLSERGVYVVRIISGDDNDKNSDFVGVNNYAYGMTAARLLGSFAATERSNILVLADAMSSPDSAARRAGFDAILQLKFSWLAAQPTLETYGSTTRAEHVLSKALDSYQNIGGIYVLSTEGKPVLDAIVRLKLGDNIPIVAHERCETNLLHLKSGVIDALIVQDAGHVVRSATRKLRARCDQRDLVKAQEQIRIEVLLQENLL